MSDAVGFWGTVAFCACFYFSWTITGLQLAGEHEAARLTNAILLAIVLPSSGMFFREVMRTFWR